ncbi:uncharacterized protein [Prorops nasuta]
MADNCIQEAIRLLNVDNNESLNHQHHCAEEYGAANTLSVFENSEFGINLETVVQNEETESLRELLNSWGQETLLQHLLRQKVNVSVLKVIKQHHIKNILSDLDMGTQILFEHNLEEWRRIIGFPLIMCCGEPPILRSNSPTSFASSKSSTTVSRYSPYPDITNRLQECHISLSNILNENPKGMMLIEYYNKYSKFEEEQRVALINIIVQYFGERNIEIRLPTSYKLEREILERFPNEKLEYYRTGKRGKLYNKFCNSTKSFKAAVCKHILPKSIGSKSSTLSYRPAKSFEPEKDGESCLRALKYDNLTCEQFDSVWKACTQYRLTDLRTLKSTQAILDKWFFYKQPSGYRLIDMDFKAAYENESELLSSWPRCVEQLIKFLSIDFNIKERNSKSLIAEIKNRSDLDQNSLDACLLLILHAYFVPTSRIVKKDENGKNKTKRFTIKDSQESFLFLASSIQEVEDHLDYLRRMKENIQPFIYCLGSNIFSINEIYIFFDNIRYKAFSVIRALDICFKIFYVFNLEFPTASVIFYTFIENYFFKLKPKQNFSKIHIISEFLDNNNI